MSVTWNPARWSLRTALPGRQSDDDGVVRARVEARSSARTRAPGRRRSCRSRGSRRRGCVRGRAASACGRSASRQGSQRPGALIGALARRAGRGGAGSARRRRPTRTCRARRREGSRTAARPRRGPADVGRDQQDARRQVAGIGVDAGVVVEISGRPSSKWMPAATRRSPTVRNASRSGAVGAELLEQAAEEDRLWRRRRASAGRGPSRPSLRWWRSMKASRSRERVGRNRSARRRRPPRLGGSCAGSRGAPSCRASRGSRRTTRRPAASTTGQTSSRSTLSVQPSAISRRAERGRQGVGAPGRRSAAGAGRRRPTATGADRRRRRRGEMRGDAPRRPPAGRPARRGPSRSRRGSVAPKKMALAVGGDRRQRRRRRRGASSSAVAASVGSTSWRCMSGTIATVGWLGVGACRRPASARGRSRHRRPTTPDGRPSELNGVAHGVAAASASQVVARDLVEGPLLDAGGRGQTGRRKEWTWALTARPDMRARGRGQGWSLRRG